MTGKVLALARRSGKRAPMEELAEAEISLEEGLGGDFRGARKAAQGTRQVTVLSREAWQTACQALEAELPWTTRRSNILIEGLDLAETEGRHIKIGAVELEICEECDPCSRMDEQHQGLTGALTPDWRGGVACRVVTGGTIKLGDPVELS